MSNHTPGPWTVGHEQIRVYDGMKWSEFPIHVGPEKNIGNAFVSVSLGGDGATKYDKESVFANARLIAAAPEMIHALKLVQEELEQCDCEVLFAAHCPVPPNCALCNVKAAIAKATGCEPISKDD